MVRSVLQAGMVLGTPLLATLLPVSLPSAAGQEPADEPAAAADTTRAEPTAGYEKGAFNGLFIQSPDGEFRLNIGAYTQARWNANWRSAPEGEDDFNSGFSLEHTRIFFEGRFTPHFDYHFRIDINSSAEFDLLAASLQWNISDRWSLRGGRHFMSLSREDWTYLQDLLTTEFSPNDFTFAIGSSLGAEAHYQADRTRFWVGLGNGVYGGKRDFPSAGAAEIALTTRWEFQAAGTDWSAWDDLIGRAGHSPAVLIGLAGGASFRERSDDPEYTRGAQLNADVSLLGRGYTAMVAGSWTRREPIDGDAFNNFGLMAQGGWFAAKKLQLYSQYNLVSPGDQPGDLETFHSLTFGTSYFPFTWTNRWKFSAEAGYLFSALDRTIVEASGSLGWLPSSEPGQLYLRLQAQFGF